MIKQFIDTVKKTDATVDVISKTPQALQNCLKERIQENKNVVIAEPILISRSLFEPLIDHPHIICKPSAQQLADCQIGIGEAFAGVTRTGSVCVSLDSPLSGFEGIISRNHIVILDAENIVTRPKDIFDLELAKNIQNGWVFITGPSATADMGELVKGAHGPAKLHLIILE